MKHAIWNLLLASATLATAMPSARAGQFKHVVYYKAGRRSEKPYQVIATHITNSGNVDLVVGDYLSDRVSILLGNGDGTFQKALTFPVAAPIGIGVGDFNEDGIPDLAVVESGGTGDGAVSIFLGDGKGHFNLSASYAIGVASVAVAIADLDGDGHLDIAVTNQGFENQSNVMTFFGNGHGKLKGRKTYELQGASGIAAGDLNGDGRPDLAVASDSLVTILINDGTGKFQAPVYYGVNGYPVDVKIADLRNNGKQDLIVADEAEGMDIWLNKGDGTFGDVTTYMPFGNTEPPDACVVADFNLNGHLDVACSANNFQSYFFYGEGNGKFKFGGLLNDDIKGNGAYSIAAGDFDNDGAPDLAIPIQNYGKVAILLNTK
jgi:FG-GAP-like repeat